jgi:hypothetical protein
VLPGCLQTDACNQEKYPEEHKAFVPIGEGRSAFVVLKGLRTHHTAHVIKPVYPRAFVAPPFHLNQVHHEDGSVHLLVLAGQWPG